MASSRAQHRNLQAELFVYEKSYTQEFYRVLSYAGTRLASRAAQGASVREMVDAVYDLLSKPVLEVYEKLFYEVELAMGRRTLQEVLGPTKSIMFAKAEDEQSAEWEIWDPYKSQFMQDWNTRRTAVNIKAIAESSKDAIRRSVASALADGADNAELARRLRNTYAFSLERAQRIAQTEVNSAQNAAGHIALQTFADPNSLLKSWLSSGDRRVRHSHQRAASSQVDIPFNEPFRVGSSLMAFPGDSSLGAAAKEIIRCRCTATYGRNPGYRPPKPTAPVTPPPTPPPPRTPVVPVRTPVPSTAPAVSIPIQAGQNRVLVAELNRAFEDAPADLKAAIARTDKLKGIQKTKASKTSFYRSSESSIHMSEVTLRNAARKYGTYRHEYGHHMDYMSSWISNVPLVHTPRDKGGLQTAIREARAKYRVIKDDPKLFKALQSLGHRTLMGSNGANCVADILGTISYGEVGGGHSVEYYRRPQGADSEIYANLVELYANPKHHSFLEAIETLFPSLVQDFRAGIARAAGVP